MPKYSYGKDDDESSVGFGGTKPKQTKPKAAKTFNQLVRSIYRSTIMAQRKVDEQVVEHFLNRYFDKDGHPNLFRLSLPTHDGDPVEVDVPLGPSCNDKSSFNSSEIDNESKYVADVNVCGNFSLMVRHVKGWSSLYSEEYKVSHVLSCCSNPPEELINSLTDFDS